MQLRDCCVKTLLWVLVFFTVADSKRRRTKRGNGKCSTDSLVEYNLSFFGDWSKENFPRMYPKYRPHAQWSKLYGLTHGPVYKLWSDGTYASPAVKKFVEERSTLILEKQAQGYNDTYDIFTAAPIRGGLGRSSVRILADGRHSKVSFLVKIIPSPDWFVGVNGLDLCRNGRWRRKVYAHLRPMDAGTDKGLTYTSPNWPAHPQQKIFEITPSFPDHPASSFFYPDRSRLPRIAHAILERVSEYQQRGRVTNVRYNSQPNTEVIRQDHELLTSKSSISFGADDEEDIPLNTKLDDALVEKLESDIQRNLKTAPRQTFFLQRMMKNGGKPLADQSSEEDEDESEGVVRSAASYLDQKFSIRQTTLYQAPAVTSTTPAPIQKKLNRWTDEDDSDDNGSRDHTRFVLGQSRDRDDTVNVDRSNIDRRLQIEQEHSYDLNSRHVGQSLDNDPEELDRQENIKLGGISRHETTTRPTRASEERIIPDVDDDYGAAYSASSAKTMESTEVYKENDLPSRVEDANDNTDSRSNTYEVIRARELGRGQSNVNQNRDEYERRNHQNQNRDEYERRNHQNRDEYERRNHQNQNIDRDVDDLRNQQQRNHHHDNQNHRSHHHDNQNSHSQHRDNHHQRGHHDNQDTLGSSRYDEISVDRQDTIQPVDNTDSTEDTYIGRDNVDVQTETEIEKLESLGIFDENPTPKKGDIDEQLDCLVAEWTEWSSCSKTCGFGVRTRSREVIQHSHNGGMNCPRIAMEVLCGSMRTCNWNHFNSIFGKYKDSKQRRRRRRRRRLHRS